MNVKLRSIKLYVSQAIENIKCHLLRSFLTLLGVLVGTAAVVALLTGSELATQSALSQFKKLGTDLLAVNLQDNKTAIADNQNIDQLTTQPVNGILSTSPYTNHYSPVILDNQKLDLNTLGVTQELLHTLKLELLAGRFISDLDNNAFYCVLGNEVATTLSSDPSDLIGRQVRINSFYFTIVGILKETDKNLFLFADSNQSVFMPIKTSLMLYNDAKIKNYIFKLITGTKPKQVEQDLTQQLQADLPGIQFRFSSPESIIQNMESQNKIFKLLLGFIGGIALLVGGIGVMNIMLVSVSERRREIGIRMALGARQQDILYLFLAEAAVLTLLGGILGVILGEVIGLLTAKISHWEYHFIFFPVFIGFLVSVAVGLFFGYYPAVKASKSDPIEILRTA